MRILACLGLLAIIWYVQAVVQEKPRAPRKAPAPKQATSPKPQPAKQKPAPTKPKAPSPTVDDTTLYEAYQKALHQYPDLEESAMAARVGRRYGVSGAEVEAAWKRVYLGRNSRKGKIEAAVKARLHSVYGKIESVIYQPANASVTIKIKSKPNLTAGLTAKAIKRDLISATHAGFQASSTVSRVDVWVMALTAAGVIKVASCRVDRSLYRQLGSDYFKYPLAANVTRLQPWLHDSMR